MKRLIKFLFPKVYEGIYLEGYNACLDHHEPSDYDDNYDDEYNRYIEEHIEPVNNSCKEWHNKLEESKRGE